MGIIKRDKPHFASVGKYLLGGKPAHSDWPQPLQNPCYDAPTDSPRPPALLITDRLLEFP
jgi:hypothetical protein